jgi:hypothetical protein
MNLDMVYSPRKGIWHDRGGIFPLEIPKPGPVSGSRAIAVDYSGKCGAPALFAVVDKINGGPERHWVWHLPPARDISAKAAGNTFTIVQGDASLHATFVPVPDLVVKAPGSLDILPTALAADKKRLQAKRLNREWKGPEPEPVQFDIMATAPAGQSYFVVMTLQRGEPPKVQIKGEGLKATVCVGKRQVRFDGEKVVIEDVQDPE